MSGTTTRLLRSEYTSQPLRRMLGICGSRTAAGHWTWCRQPGCDRCRRFRAKRAAEGIGHWVDGCLTAHCLRQVEATTRLCGSPAELLDEVRDVRRAATHSYDYRQRTDERWGDVWSYGWWLPSYSAGTWTATLRGVVYLGGVPEVRYLDEIGDVHGLRLARFERSVVGRDVQDHMINALGTTHGVRACSDQEFSNLYGELHHRHGFRALVARRGLQQTRN